MIRTAARSARSGFTLVELLVAAAVCVLIMAVLATAFQLGIDTMREMKGSGDMMDQLRGAGTILKDDLKVPHLLDADLQPRKLSSFRWDQLSVTDKGAMATPRYELTGWEAPKNGFFRIGSAAVDGTANVAEAQDADGLASARFTNHYLHFTSVLDGSTNDSYYTALVAGQTQATRSIAAEIAYFLEATPSGGATPSGTPLYRLIRRQRLVAISDTDRRDRPWPSTYDHAVISLRPSGVATPSHFLNTMLEIANPDNRLGRTRVVSPANPGGGPQDSTFAPIQSTARLGEDTLLSNVISFEVQLNYSYPTDPRLPIVPNHPRPFATNGTTTTTTSEYPFDTLPRNKPATGSNTAVAAGTFDSWWEGYSAWTSDIDQTNGVVRASTNVPPTLARVQAVQIRIRVWNPKTQNARQLTFVQDL